MSNSEIMQSVFVARSVDNEEMLLVERRVQRELEGLISRKYWRMPEHSSSWWTHKTNKKKSRSEMVQISTGFLGCLLFFPSVSLLGGFKYSVFVHIYFIICISTTHKLEVKMEYLTRPVAARDRHANIPILCSVCWSWLHQFDRTSHANPDRFTLQPWIKCKFVFLSTMENSIAEYKRNFLQLAQHYQDFLCNLKMKGRKRSIHKACCFKVIFSYVSDAVKMSVSPGVLNISTL